MQSELCFLQSPPPQRPHRRTDAWTPAQVSQQFWQQLIAQVSMRPLTPLSASDIECICDQRIDIRKFRSEHEFARNSEFHKRGAFRNDAGAVGNSTSIQRGVTLHRTSFMQSASRKKTDRGHLRQAGDQVYNCRRDGQRRAAVPGLQLAVVARAGLRARDAGHRPRRLGIRRIIGQMWHILIHVKRRGLYW